MDPGHVTTYTLQIYHNQYIGFKLLPLVSMTTTLNDGCVDVEQCSYEL